MQLSNAHLASSPCHSQILAVEIKSVNETIALAVTKSPGLDSVQTTSTFERFLLGICYFHNTWFPPTTWANHIHTQNFVGLLSWVLLSRSFRISKRVVTSPWCRGQHRQRSEPGQSLRQAGNKPESNSHKRGPVQSACYRPLENYLSNAAYIWA